MPAVAFGDVLEGLEFPGGHGTSTNVPDLAAVDDIVERLHNLLPRSVAVQPVDLQHVDIGTQTLDTGVDGVENVLAGETHAVHEVTVVGPGGGNWGHFAFVVDTKEAFGQDDHAVAGDLVLLEGFAEDFFGAAVGVDVGL